jgi:hypothetical protein
MDKLIELLRNDELLVFGSLTIVGVVFIVAHHWCKLRIAGWEASLKQSMLEAGMSAEDIRTVLEATSLESGGCRRKARPSRPAKTNGETAWRPADPKDVAVR